MSRRCDFGMACYGKPQQLPRTIAAIQQHSVTDWRLWLIVNPHPKHDMRELVSGLADRDKRIVPVWMESNVGYAGAVNKFLSLAETEYMAYVDDDSTVNSPGWDETLCGLLDRHHEVGIVFPNGGAYMIDRGNYQEVLWGVGFCWVINRLCAGDVNDFIKNPVTGSVFCRVMDESLGHQEEADLCQRVRMAGWKCAALTGVSVSHAATATNDPASLERINRGVVRWVDKWNRYFNGKNFNYHSPNVTRFEDWPPNALYLEEYWKTKWFPGPGLAGDIRGDFLNASPEVVKIDGREYDLIRVPKFKDFYRGRVF